MDPNQGLNNSCHHQGMNWSKRSRLRMQTKINAPSSVVFSIQLYLPRLGVCLLCFLGSKNLLTRVFGSLGFVEINKRSQSHPQNLIWLCGSNPLNQLWNCLINPEDEEMIMLNLIGIMPRGGYPTSIHQTKYAKMTQDISGLSNNCKQSWLVHLLPHLTQPNYDPHMLQRKLLRENPIKIPIQSLIPLSQWL